MGGKGLQERRRNIRSRTRIARPNSATPTGKCQAAGCFRDQPGGLVRGLPVRSIIHPDPSPPTRKIQFQQHGSCQGGLGAGKSVP